MKELLYHGEGKESCENSKASNKISEEGCGEKSSTAPRGTQADEGSGEIKECGVALRATSGQALGSEKSVFIEAGFEGGFEDRIENLIEDGFTEGFVEERSAEEGGAGSEKIGYRKKIGGEIAGFEKWRCGWFEDCHKILPG